MIKALFFRVILSIYIGITIFSADVSSVLAQDSPNTMPALSAESAYVSEALASIKLLAFWHYKRLPFEDSLSRLSFDNYISSLDPGKLYFLSADVSSYKARYSDQLDDWIKAGNLARVYDIFNDFRGRVLERLDWVDAYLLADMNLSSDEVIDVRYKLRVWCDGEEDLDIRWGKILRNDVISLMLADKTLEESVSLLQKRYERVKVNISQSNSRDVFELFMRSVAMTYDPHTTYFSPITAENFNIEMSRSFEGIGARLSRDLEYTIVNDIIAGGPAYKAGSLRKNDKIIGIAQGDNGEFVDVVGWRLDDVVQLIRGPRETVVRLQVFSSEETYNDYRVVRLVREKITIDELAKKEVIDLERNGERYKLGWITIPSFYIDHQAMRRKEAYRSVSKDVRVLLEELTLAGVEGILLDVRRNGGGALSEAVKLTGLFIEKGEVVQVENTFKKLEVLFDDDSGVAYEAPLMVLVDRTSASASEIFAAAIQDYARGFVVGEPTFGKGTVQELVPLSRVIPAESTVEEKVGQVKLTVARFYRVNGKSTQKVGVIPDLFLPSSINDPNRYREAEESSSLLWGEISAVRDRFSDKEEPQDLPRLMESLEKDLQEPHWVEFKEKIKEKEADESRFMKVLSLEERKAALTQEKQGEKEVEKEVFTEEKEVEKPLMERVKEDKHLMQSLLLLSDYVSFAKPNKTTSHAEK